MPNPDVTVKFRTQGQKLILVHDAPLATGAISAVYVEIEFDPSWDMFPHKTVNFYKAWTTKCKVVPTGVNYVEIPAEILQYYQNPESGCWDEHCWINVNGVGLTRTISTNRIETKIALGGVGDITDPTPTVYEQLLSLIESGGVTGAVTSVNGKVGDVVLSSDDIPEGAEHLYLTQEERYKIEHMEVGTQSDWDVTDPEDPAYIHNKPDLFDVVDGKLCAVYYTD